MKEFLTDPKLMNQICDFGSLTESLIRDLIALGIRDWKLQKKTPGRLQSNARKAFKAAQAAAATWPRMQALERKNCKCFHRYN